MLIEANTLTTTPNLHSRENHIERKGTRGHEGVHNFSLAVYARLFYANANEADAYTFYRCFSAFSVRHKNTRQPFSGTAERIFMKLLPNDSGENGVRNAVPKWGLGPRLIFLGAKNYTLRTWW